MSARTRPAAEPRTPAFTPEAYLDWEPRQERRYELVDGEVHLMAGGTYAHHTIAINLATVLKPHLRGGPCAPLLERKVHIPKGNYRYPDVTVDCAPNKSMGDLAAIEPRLVFEIESPSNSAIDELERFEDYQSTPAIQQIIVLAQSSARARIYTRDETGWRGETIAGLDAVLDLASIGLALPLRDVYDGVTFEAPNLS